MDDLSSSVAYFAPFGHAIVLAIAGLLPIVDPLGSVPLYMEFTRGLPLDQRRPMARAVAADTFLLLLASALVGAYVLDFFGISIPAVQVGGGVVVCAMGWSLLTKPEGGDDASRESVREMAADDVRRRAFYPLTLPLTVGPGSLSVAVTLGATPNAGVRTLFVTAAGHVVGILLIAVAVYLCYRYAVPIMRKLGDTGRSVLMRLSAFIVVCIGVQITWNGVHGLIVASFPELG